MPARQSPFVMSKYCCEEDLVRDKAAYYAQLARTLAVNARNPKLTDAEFRQVVISSTSEFEDEGRLAEVRQTP